MLTPTRRQYLYMGAAFVVFFVTGHVVYQLGVPKLMPYVSMYNLQQPQAPASTHRGPLGVGMGPYSLMENPPLNDTFMNPSKKRIAVVMSVHSDQPVYSASFLNHQRYCQIHGYRLMTQSKYLLPEEPFPHPRGHEYQKMAVLMQALLIGLDREEFDWIWWTDVDTFITDPSIPLEAFLPPPDRPDAYFIGNRDYNGFNAGALLIKVSTWTIQLVSMVMADPYFLYNSGALDDENKHKPALNDQASLSRIFQAYPMFGNHFQEIPSNWMNTYPPYELDGKLNTTIPHLLPPKAEEWVQKMNEALSQKAPKPHWRRAPVPKNLPIPPPLDDETLGQLKHVRHLPSTFMPNEFEDCLQIHLVDARKWQFDFLALVSINDQMMQVAMSTLILRYHERIAEATLDPLTLWEEERSDSLLGLNYIQNPRLFERRDKWYRERKVGIEGMTWLDV